MRRLQSAPSLPERERAVGRLPKDAEEVARFAAHLLQSGRVERALTVAHAACLLDEHEPLAHFVIGCILAQSGDTHAAVVAFSEAVLLRPDWLDARANLAELQLLLWQPLGCKPAIGIDSARRPYCP